MTYATYRRWRELIYTLMLLELISQKLYDQMCDILVQLVSHHESSLREL